MSQSNEPDQEVQSLLLEDLASFRSSKDISIQEIADSIKVNREVIEKIESQRFSEIGAKTFVKGYLKNYSKYLGIDADHLLQQLPNEFHSSTNLVIPEALMSKPMSKARRHSNSIGRYAVGTFLLATLATSIWFVWDKWEVKPATTDINAMDLVELENSSNPDNNSEVSDSTDQDGQQFIYSSLIPQAASRKKPVAETEIQLDDSEQQSVLDPQDSDRENLEAETNAVDDTKAEGVIVLELEEAEATTTEVQAPTQDSSNTDMLYSIELTLTEESWVEIKDSQNRKIEYDMLKAGTHQYETSDSQLHFRVGNAQDAQIRINDEVIDLKEYLRQNIADFNWPLNDVDG